MSISFLINVLNWLSRLRKEKTRYDYDAVISESWITQDKKNSTANEVVLNIENNETVFPRTATVEMLDKVITIFQYG